MTTKTTISLTDEDALDPRTRALRWQDPRVCNWLCATQHWAWDGGDAIVVLTGPDSTARDGVHVVIRVGDEVRVVCARSLYVAQEAVGLNPESFKIA